MELNFSQFAKILYPVFSDGKKQADFVRELFEHIVQLPSEENALTDKDETTFRQYFNGRLKIISLSKAISRNVNLESFADYIDEKNKNINPAYDSLLLLFEKLSPYCGETFNTDNPWEYHNGLIIGRLFQSIIYNAAMSQKQRQKTKSASKCSLELNDYDYIYPPFYIERQKEIQNLYQAFLTQGSYVQVISGTSGTGKTEFAYNFSNAARRNGWFEHVIFTTYNTTLKDTISSLKTDGTFSELKDPFKEKVDLLNEIQSKGKTLLIIDNYYNPIDFDKELSINCDAYKKLLDTKCSILMTSTTNLEKCYATHVIEIEPLPIKDLIELFRNIKGDNDDDVQELESLIQNYLLYNVYLVILSADLARQGTSVKDIIGAFDTRTIDDNDDLVSWRKNGEFQEGTMLAHFCLMMDDNKVIHPDNKKEQDDVYKVLTVLSFLPVGGIRKQDFYQVAFEDKKVVRPIVQRLQRHHLLFEKNEYIYLHPLVREYITRNIPMREEYIYTYVANVVQKLCIETYAESFMYWLKNGREIDMLLNKELAKPNNQFSNRLQLSAVALCSYISSCYDIIKQKEAAYQYGIRAYDRLQTINWMNETEDNKILIASCYNVIGYAILHRKSKDKIQREIDWNIAYRSIYKAEEVLHGVKNEKASILLTKIHGNLGACYVDAKKYDEALIKHEIALAERNSIIQKEKSPECLLLLATTNRCLGTDWFYLRQTKDPIDCLKKSYNFNLESIELFKQVYGNKHLETTIGCNRLVGTGIELISTLQNDELLKEHLGETFDELIESFYAYINESVEFLADIGFSINDEIKDCLKRIEQLTLLLESRNILTEDKISFNMNVVEKLSVVPGINDEVHEILERISSTTLRKVK